jgi:hypothetical protein
LKELKTLERLIEHYEQKSIRNMEIAKKYEGFKSNKAATFERISNDYKKQATELTVILNYIKGIHTK